MSMNTYDSQPDIMAIGDSMYQGIRSLSFLPSMVQHSTPMQAAAALRMVMVAPDLQQPLLFDLEEELRRGGLLNLVKHIRDRCVDNLRFWPSHQPWSQHEAFDNVTIGRRSHCLTVGRDRADLPRLAIQPHDTAAGSDTRHPRTRRDHRPTLVRTQHLQHAQSQAPSRAGQQVAACPGR